MKKFNKFLSALGPFPTKVSLDSVILESVDCGYYIREKVEFNVEKGDRIRAYLLLPKDRSEPLPAVFCHHQHGGDFQIGKSEVVGLSGNNDQAYAVELAKLGYIAFAPDAISFEERCKSKEDPEKAAYFELATRLLRSETLAAKALHDISVGIDYLQSRNEINQEKIGFMGHSYGGRMAIWGPAFDKRIKVSVSSCGCVSYKNSIDKGIGIQMEFCIPGIMSVGDIEDLIRMIDPSSLFIMSGKDDKYSFGAERIYSSVASSFINGVIDVRVYPGGHLLSEEMKRDAYAFLEKYLKG